MKNAAGFVVRPSTAAVQAAMTDFLPVLRQNGLSTAIYNGKGSTTWPLSYISYMLLNVDSINAYDCQSVYELLIFLSWTQLNDQAAEAASKLGFASLVIPYRKRMIDALGTITCSGKKVLPTAMLMGQGINFPVFDAWASRYEAGEFRAKYFSGTSSVAQALALVGRPVVHTYSALLAKKMKPRFTYYFFFHVQGDIDYGGIRVPLTAAESQQYPYLKSFQVVIKPYTPVFNLPSLSKNAQLVLDLRVIAHIFMGLVTRWNDPSILALNPGLTFPNADIRVVYVANIATINDLMIEVLTSVPEYNETVRHYFVT